MHDEGRSYGNKFYIIFLLLLLNVYHLDGYVLPQKHPKFNCLKWKPQLFVVI